MSSVNDGKSKVMEQVKSGEITDLTPQRPDPWKNIVNLLQGGFCDPKKGVTKNQKRGRGDFEYGQSKPNNEDEETQDSTSATPTESDEMEPSDVDVVNNVKDEAEKSSNQTWNTGPQDHAVTPIDEIQNEQNADNEEINAKKPKSILKKRSPGPVVVEKKNAYNAIFMFLTILAVLASRYYFTGVDFSPTSVSDVEKSRVDAPRVVSLETYENTEGKPEDNVVENENDNLEPEIIVEETVDDARNDVKDDSNTFQNEIPAQETNVDENEEVNESLSEEDTVVVDTVKQKDSDISKENNDAELDVEETDVSEEVHEVVSEEGISHETVEGKLVEEKAFQNIIDSDGEIEVKSEVNDIELNTLDEALPPHKVSSHDINTSSDDNLISETEQEPEHLEEEIVVSVVEDLLDEVNENSSSEQLEDEPEVESEDDLLTTLKNEIDAELEVEIEKKAKAQFVKVLGQAGQIVKTKAQSTVKSLSPQVQKGLNSTKPVLKKLQTQLQPGLKKLNPAVKQVRKKVTAVFDGFIPGRKKKAESS